jgi:muramoyltetrapeptide carboxypeptidase
VTPRLRLCPPPLARGDRVAVVAPAGPVDRAALEAGLATLAGLGVEPRASEGLGARHLFAAGTRARRLDELNAALADPDVAGIVCARGGAGVLHLLDGLDLEALRARPRRLLGYSDITFLHLVLDREAQVSFHGPMVARELATGLFDRDSLEQGLFGEGAPWAAPEGTLRALRPGAAEGVLRGGCLSILASAVGTPWAFVAEPGTLLFLEDVDEPPYRIDRMLRQLRAAGAFDGVVGCVFGEMAGCAANPANGYRLEEVLVEALAGLEMPVAIGLPSGHTTVPNVTLPLGLRAHLACAAGEAGVPRGAAFEVLEEAR